MEENEIKKKKNNSLIIAIIIVVAIIGISYLGIYLYANYLVKYYREETDKLVPLAQSYVKTNEGYYGENIFNMLEKSKKVTDGLIYVNENLEVALAIIYDDTVCYIKYYNSEGYIDNIKPEYCKMFLKIHLAGYNKDDNSNEEDNNVNDDGSNNETNDNTNNGTNNDNINDIVINQLAFDIKFNEGDKVSDIKLTIKLNGHPTTDYSYDYFHIYKVDNNDYNACDIDLTYTKLNDNYIFSSEEKYVVVIEELKIKNVNFNQLAGYACSYYVNGIRVDNLKKWCLGSQYESGNSLSFRFELPTSVN